MIGQVIGYGAAALVGCGATFIACTVRLIHRAEPVWIGTEHDEYEQARAELAAEAAAYEQAVADVLDLVNERPAWLRDELTHLALWEQEMGCVE